MNLNQKAGFMEGYVEGINMIKKAQAEDGTRLADLTGGKRALRYESLKNKAQQDVDVLAKTRPAESNWALGKQVMTHGLGPLALRGIISNPPSPSSQTAVNKTPAAIKGNMSEIFDSNPPMPVVGTGLSGLLSRFIASNPPPPAKK